MAWRIPFLIQRLVEPRKDANPIIGSNPFVFGGGLKNGGLSDEATKLLDPLFGYDYMGSAEFEFGALPKAYQQLALACNAGTAVAAIIEIEATAKFVPPKPRAINKKLSPAAIEAAAEKARKAAQVRLRTSKPIPVADTSKTQLHKVFVLAPSQDMLNHIKATLTYCATVDKSGWPIRPTSEKDRLEFQAPPYVWRALNPRDTDYTKIIGGIDLDNAWIYLTNETSFRGLCEVFGVQFEAADLAATIE